MTPIELKEILASTGIRPTEISQLFRVDKSTIYRWLEGESLPRQESILLHVEDMYKKLLLAVKVGYLPIKDAKGRQRMVHIRAAIKLIEDEIRRIQHYN